jgi:hypothetical protein
VGIVNVNLVDAVSATSPNGLVGVVTSGGSPGQPVTVANSGWNVPILLVGGLTPLAGQPVYLSNTPGYGTTTAPGNPILIATIQDPSNYGINSTVKVILNVPTPIPTAPSFHLHPTIAGTVGNYPLQSTLNDISGNNYNLTNVTGSQSYVTLDAADGGLLGYNFDGTRSVQSSVISDYYNLTNLTIEFLLLPDSVGPKGRFAYNEGIGLANWGALTDNSGVIYWESDEYDYTGTHTFSPSTSTFGVNGRANHIGITRKINGSSIEQRLYINGVLTATTFYTKVFDGGVPADNSAAFIIGGNLGGLVQGPSGIIASMRILNYCADAVQIQTDYNYTIGEVYGVI